MRILTIVVTTILAAGVVAAPATGQSLAERIAAVKKKRLEQAAGTRTTDPRLKMLQTLLYSPVTMSFDKTPARDAFESLQTALEINLVVRYSDDPAGHGIDPATPITLTADRMRAVDLLDLVLEHCSAAEPCTWQLRGSFVEVGTKERLAAPSARVLRAYPIDDLLYQPPRFEDSPKMGFVPEFPSDFYSGYGGATGGYGLTPGGYGSASVSGSISVGPHGGGSVAQSSEEQVQSLIDLVLDVVEPSGWIQNGGTWASLAYRDGALIVYAPDFIQRQLSGYPKVPPPSRDRLP